LGAVRLRCMQDTKLYERLLGLEAPWRVQAVELELGQGQVVVRVEADGQVWACPECNLRMHVHEYATRRWRHLDTCQFKTIIEAQVPRVKCERHGTITVRVPWAEKHGRFTALFERLAIDMMRDCSIAAASKYLRLSWDETDHIKAKAVERGLRRKGMVKAAAICIDEKSVARGHDYVTVVVKVTEDGPIVDFIGDGREEAALDGFWKAHDEETLKAIRCASMDMWKPYLNAVEVNLPAGKQAISHDPFHIIQRMNEAVDAVRRYEVALLPHEEGRRLKGTRFMWLYGFENLPEKWGEQLRALKQSQMKTARAWRLKETLRSMYQCETWAQAEAFFTDWYRDAMRSKLDPVKKVARMLKEHLAQVLNYFIHRVTNAYSEGFNSIIQALIKRANGYRSRLRLKRDLFFHLGGLDLHPEIAQ
jgi:transposase